MRILWGIAVAVVVIEIGVRYLRLCAEMFRAHERLCGRWR